MYYLFILCLIPERDMRQGLLASVLILPVEYTVLHSPETLVN